MIFLYCTVYTVLLVEGVRQKQEDNESAKQHNAFSLFLSLSLSLSLSLFLSLSVVKSLYLPYTGILVLGTLSPYLQYQNLLICTIPYMSIPYYYCTMTVHTQKLTIHVRALFHYVWYFYD